MDILTIYSALVNQPSGSFVCLWSVGSPPAISSRCRDIVEFFYELRDSVGGVRLVDWLRHLEMSREGPQRDDGVALSRKLYIEVKPGVAIYYPNLPGNRTKRIRQPRLLTTERYDD